MKYNVHGRAAYKEVADLHSSFLPFVQAVVNSTITPNMTFTKTSQKFGQWSDHRANTVYGLGFSSELELTKVMLPSYIFTFSVKYYFFAFLTEMFIVLSCDHILFSFS